ncbi:MAG: site-specific DNA-methyltransferase [Calditrichota bacterium]
MNLRFDQKSEYYYNIIPQCRLKRGEIWEDPLGGHRVGCLDAADRDDINNLMAGEKAVLAAQDPPYNLAVFERKSVADYIQWCRKWVSHTCSILADNSSLYIWLGADQRQGFKPLPEFMLLMEEMPLRSRSFITLRNQRGYGTSRNWMAVRQELLFYTKGNHPFNVEAEYTDIPKILRGYYKEINGRKTENLERSRSPFIRAGNVWVDIQQVFYRLEENVPGCYAQKPLKAMERIISASSVRGDLIVDFFAHAGTTLLAAERLTRRCFTCDIDPVFCELTIRRLERWRAAGKTGWQRRNPFVEDK